MDESCSCPPEGEPSAAPGHVPVLLDEVVEGLSPRPGEVYLDCTAGLGGHARVVAERLGDRGEVWLTDLDPGNLERATAATSASLGRADGVRSRRGNFADAPRWVSGAGGRVDLLLADLGFASPQVDDPARGLSFRAEGPLDMRLDPSGPVTASELVSTLPARELAEIIARYGEDRFANRIAEKIVEARTAGPIATTSRLAEIVRSAVPAAARRGRGRGAGRGAGRGGGSGSIDPATRTFQALRIAVNDEIGSLESLLTQIGHAAEDAASGRPTWLSKGARIALIAFHSLEDRPVKRSMSAWESSGLGHRVTRSAVVASASECERNPRARSAKMRVFCLNV